MTVFGARVFVYVEGGGHSDDLKSELRRGFATFLEKSPLGSKRRPRIVACGDRVHAFESFKTAVAQRKTALLLVDSEDAVAPELQSPIERPEDWRPWKHLHRRDGWEQPKNSTERDCHLMTQCMETWLVADWAILEKYFGQGFAVKHEPTGPIESVSKAAVYAALKWATKDSKTKGEYKKGRDSFELLARIDPHEVCAASPWAKRFVDELGLRKL